MSNRKEILQVDQTDFVDQAPASGKPAGKKFNFKEFKKNKNLLPFYILTGLLLLFFLLALFSFLNSRNGSGAEKKLELEERLINLDPLNKRIYLLKGELEEADPTRQSLPFPQVDLEFNID